MEQVLLVIHVIIAIALVGMVLIQRSETDGFGLGSGSGSNLLSGRSTANLLTRTTAILATLFIVNSLALSIMASNRSSTSIVDAIEREQSKEAAAPQAVEKPAAKAEKKATPPSVPDAGAVKPAAKTKPAKPSAVDEVSDIIETE